MSTEKLINYVKYINYPNKVLLFALFMFIIATLLYILEIEMRFVSILFAIIAIVLFATMLSFFYDKKENVRNSSGFIEDKTANLITQKAEKLGLSLYWRRLGNVVVADTTVPVNSMFSISPNQIKFTTDFIRRDSYLSNRNNILQSCQLVLEAFSAGKFRAISDTETFKKALDKQVFESEKMSTRISIEYADTTFYYSTTFKNNLVQVLCSVEIVYQ